MANWTFTERTYSRKPSGGVIHDARGVVIAILPANPGERTHEEAVACAKEICDAHNSQSNGGRQAA